MATIPIIVEINEEIITIEIPNPINIEAGYDFQPYQQQNADWLSTTDPTKILNKPILGTSSAKDIPSSGNAIDGQVVLGSDSRLINQEFSILNVSIHSENYLLNILDNVVVFDSSSYAFLPKSNGSGKTYRIVSRNCTVTIFPDGDDKIKGETSQTITGYEYFILTDCSVGSWD